MRAERGRQPPEAIITPLYPEPGAGGEVKAVIKEPQGASEQTVVPLPPASLLMQPAITRLAWSGDVPHQKYTGFYMKVLSKLVASGYALKIHIDIHADGANGISEHKLDEIRAALRELGLIDQVASQ